MPGLQLHATYIGALRQQSLFSCLQQVKRARLRKAINCYVFAYVAAAAASRHVMVRQGRSLRTHEYQPREPCCASVQDVALARLQLSCLNFVMCKPTMAVLSRGAVCDHCSRGFLKDAQTSLSLSNCSSCAVHFEKDEAGAAPEFSGIVNKAEPEQNPNSVPLRLPSAALNGRSHVRWSR